MSFFCLFLNFNKNFDKIKKEICENNYQYESYLPILDFHDLWAFFEFDFYVAPAPHFCSFAGIIF